MINKIKKIVNENPYKIAYKVNNEYITYKRLWDLASTYAKLLKKQGTSPVIIYGHKEIDIIISILSCLLAHRTYVPIEENTPLYRIKKIIELTKSTIILTNKHINIENIECINLKQLKKYEKYDTQNTKNENIYIIFTSGSTGEPKGVPISKENLNNFINWISKLYPLCNYKNINVLNQASFSFDLSVADLYYSLCNGQTLVAFDGNIQNYEIIFDIMNEIDVAVMTPTFIKLCLLNNEFNSKKYSNLKCIYFCGEQLETKTVKKIFEQFPNIKIINAYGPTEATSAVSAIEITKNMTNLKLLPVGKVDTFATKIEIINNEIVLKGKSVFSGYLNNYTGGYYKENGINCYKTGDIGFIKNGKLYCKGRKDNQIKYKGYRIELDEIEYNIKKIKEVKECAVIAKYNNDLTIKTIKAFIVVQENIEINDIKKELEKYIPNYMIPKTIKIINSLPVNQNGKIDRKALSVL